MRFSFFRNSNLLSVGQKNLMTKIVNTYIVYDLDNWPKISFRNATFKNCLLSETIAVKNIDKGKYVCSGYGIAFDGKGE